MNDKADDVIARLKRIIAMRTGATGQQVFEDLPRDAISTITSQAAEIERLRALLQSAHVRSTIEEGSPLGVKITAAIRGDTP
jgi:hypothetical protein